MMNGFPTESRERVVHELYTTEYRYVRQLEVVVEVSLPRSRYNHIVIFHFYYVLGIQTTIVSIARRCNQSNIC